MTDLIALVPTRGRPANAARLAAAVSELSRAKTLLVLGVDADDPELEAYQRIDAVVEITDPTDTPGMVGALNQLADRYDTQAACLGFLGDDHLPRTVGWDALLCEAIDVMGGGVAYGNDLVHGPGLATAAVMDARIPRSLGFMAPPNLWHLYVDNVWMDWGRGIGKLGYRGDVIIEHLHPLVGKAETDERYAVVNAGSVSNHDHAAYVEYVEHGLPLDIANLQARA